MKKIFFLFLIMIAFFSGTALAQIDYTVTNTPTETTIIAQQQAVITKMQTDISQMNQKLSNIETKMILSSDVDKIVSMITQGLTDAFNKAIAMQIISLFFFFLGLISAFLILKAKKLI